MIEKKYGYGASQRHGNSHSPDAGPEPSHQGPVNPGFQGSHVAHHHDWKGVMEDPDPELPRRRMKEGNGEQRFVFLDSSERNQAQTQQHEQKTREAGNKLRRNI